MSIRHLNIWGDRKPLQCLRRNYWNRGSCAQVVLVRDSRSRGNHMQVEMNASCHFCCWTLSALKIIHFCCCGTIPGTRNKTEPARIVSPQYSVVYWSLTLTPWMSPFIRNVCWGNVWCNTWRPNRTPHDISLHHINPQVENHWTFHLISTSTYEALLVLQYGEKRKKMNIKQGQINFTERLTSEAELKHPHWRHLNTATTSKGLLYLVSQW